MTVLLAIFLTLSLSIESGAQPKGFQVRYLGGTDQPAIEKDDWSNRLTILSDEIRVDLKNGQKVVIDPKTVTSISYGRAATRHVARWVSLGILVSPIALLGLFNENVQHYVSIEYNSDGQKKGILIQAHKDTYRNVLAFLRGATGQEIEIEKKNGRPKQKSETKPEG